MHQKHFTCFYKYTVFYLPLKHTVQNGIGLLTTKGAQERKIALDLDMEHDNKHVKQDVKNLGPNVTVPAVRRIPHGQQRSKTMLYCLDREIPVKQISGKHASTAYTKDLTTVINSLTEQRVFHQSPERHYKSFPNFARDPLSRLNMSDLFQWINKPKKNIDLGRKARQTIITVILGAFLVKYMYMFV